MLGLLQFSLSWVSSIFAARDVRKVLLPFCCFMQPEVVPPNRLTQVLPMAASIQIHMGIIFKELSNVQTDGRHDIHHLLAGILAPENFL